MPKPSDSSYSSSLADSADCKRHADCHVDSIWWVEMYGKIFASMFDGSLYGKGPMVMTVWAYVIAHQKPDSTVGSQVELNPEKLSNTIGSGTTEADVQKAIEFLCAPDKKSRSKECEGRRLVKLSDYDYRVVNGEKYRKIRNEEERREQNRLAQQRKRARASTGETAKERQYRDAYENGDTEACNKLTAPKSA